MEDLSAEKLRKIVHGQDKELSAKAADNALWKNLYIDRWGDLSVIQDVLLEAGIITKEVETEDPEHWMEAYETKLQEEEEQEEMLTQKAKINYDLAMKMLEVDDGEEKPKGGDEESFRKAAVHLLRVLEIIPAMPAAFAGLAHICEAMDAREQAWLLATLGAGILPDNDMLAELCRELDGEYAPKEENDLLNALEKPSRALRRKLAHVFLRFDEDGDCALNEGELGALVEAVNGQTMPPGLLENMTEKFGGNEQGFLTLPAYMRFYTFQTTKFPEETTKDLSADVFDE